VGFLAPWFLAGIAAIGLPLWIHMLRQYRSTPRQFSSLMFFEKRTQSSLKHRRLRYLLLLSLRVALLLLLALAFANPFINRTGANLSGRKMLVIAVDNSFSMRYGDHMSRAKQEAQKAVSSLNPGEQGQVLAIGSHVYVLSQPTEDAGQLRNAITAIQPSDERSSFGELARTLRTMEQSARVPLEVHFVSDMQKSSMPPSFSDLRLAEGTNLVFHPIGGTPEPNWLVESVTAPGKIYDPKKVRIQAVVAGAGTPAARRNVSLVLDNKVLDTKAVDIPANGRATAEFLALDSPYGFHKAEIRIEPGDQLREDDRFDVAVERTDPRRVLFLHAAGDTRGALYYRTALESSSDAGFVLESLAVDQAANQTLSKYAFVVLSDVGSLPPGLDERLRSYVNGGGALLVALGPASTSLARVPLVNETILESRYFSREGERFQTVGSVDPEHPAVRRANKLEGVQFFQAIRVDPGNARVIARLTDQTPLLMEKQSGEGRVMVFASTFDNISNDFPLHSSFLPFVEQSARYLSGEQERSASVAVDSYIELRSAKDQGATVEIVDPDGKRPLSMKEAASASNFRAEREGFYEVHRAGGRQEMVAVHADRRESDLAPIPPETLELWRNTGRSVAAATTNASGEQQPKPWSLWRYALLLVLITAVIESIIASRYLSVNKEAA
jgi:aerotolerance regulator-like protein/VWA domain-containing protein